MVVPDIEERFDFIIFGASGYTGKWVVESLARAIENERNKNPKDPLTFAVSGRNLVKLRSVLENASLNTGLELNEIPIIICDTGDEISVDAMCRSARVVLNCVGPYRFFGEQIVAACIRAGSHHVDISGEPQYLESMQLKYDKEAEEKEVYVVGACGFDSIPSDLGQMLLTSRMEGDVNSIETFLKVTVPTNLPGPIVNFGTWQSAIYGLAHYGELKDLRKQLYPEKLPNLEPKLKKRRPISYSPVADSWCVPFLGSDRSIMMRTQRSRWDELKERPTQIGCYFEVSSRLHALALIFFGLLFSIMVKFSFTRSLLESYPWIFSLGRVSKDGPSKAVAENTNFEMILHGLGWKTMDPDPKFHKGTNPEREVLVKVSGKNIGYGLTAECMVQSAMVLLQENDRLPGVGGVLTPGFTFANTTLIDRLNANGVTFEVRVKDL